MLNFIVFFFERISVFICFGWMVDVQKVSQGIGMRIVIRAKMNAERKKNRTKTCLETMCCLIAKWFWSIEFIAWKEHFRRKIQNIFFFNNKTMRAKFEITHQLRICFLIIFSTVFPSVSPFYFYWESLAEVLTKLIDF